MYQITNSSNHSRVLSYSRLLHDIMLYKLSLDSRSCYKHRRHPSPCYPAHVRPSQPNKKKRGKTGTIVNLRSARPRTHTTRVCFDAHSLYLSLCVPSGTQKRHAPEGEIRMDALPVITTPGPRLPIRARARTAQYP